MTTRPILDWRSQHDPKSREFPMRALIRTTVTPRPRHWKAGAVLDQGSEGACVGFGWTGELLASPRRAPAKVGRERGSAFALDVYRRAQQIDEWPGEGYSGTSVLAGAKVIQERGFIDSYRWCFGLSDVRDAIIVEGPVVLGIPWYESMYDTDAGYEVIVDGEQVGGHCILATGYHPEHPEFDGREMYRLRNSWGPTWGHEGNGWIDAGDLSDLLADGGEACVPIGRREFSIP